MRIFKGGVEAHGQRIGGELHQVPGNRDAFTGAKLEYLFEPPFIAFAGLAEVLAGGKCDETDPVSLRIDVAADGGTINFVDFQVGFANPVDIDLLRTVTGAVVTRAIAYHRAHAAGSAQQMTAGFLANQQAPISQLI